MAYLLDTNIFLRLARRHEPERAIVLSAMRRLNMRQEELCYTTQVLVEFWNVCTRPVTARGGLGLSRAVTERKARFMEQRFRLLPESLATHQEWRRLVTLHAVQGVQVLAAVMQVYGVTHLLTFNKPDFNRFQGLTAVSPADV